jgi:hypothetical protein
MRSDDSKPWSSREDEVKDLAVHRERTVFWCAAAALYGFLPVGWATGLCRWSYGARGGLPHPAWNLGFDLLAYFVGIHGLVVWPVAQWAYPQWGERRTLAVRLAVIFALLALPLLSFAHYVSAGADMTGGAEGAAVVLPALFVALYAFERTRDAWLFSSLLTVGTFPCLFLFSDTLGPFAGIWSYSATKLGFYGLRGLFPLLAVGLAIFAARVSGLAESSRRDRELTGRTA